MLLGCSEHKNNDRGQRFDKILVHVYNLAHAISCPLLLFATITE